ncbi:MAG: MOSC domain-containing protein [Gemmatimonadaceae bacterium]|nr:MOSC domain-containing protein [Gemmatimonadaceae bacterium]
MTPPDLFQSVVGHEPSPARENARASGRIVSINISAGGVPKLPVSSAYVGPLGLAGDKQRNRRFHGGPMRALCLYSLERINALRDEGHPIVPGSTGENITLEGIDWPLLVPGIHLALGPAEIAITSFTAPCGVIRRSFSDYSPWRIGEDERPGWSRVYARVIAEGTLAVGDSVYVLSAPTAG